MLAASGHPCFPAEPLQPKCFAWADASDVLRRLPLFGRWPAWRGNPGDDEAVGFVADLATNMSAAESLCPRSV